MYTCNLVLKSNIGRKIRNKKFLVNPRYAMSEIPRTWFLMETQRYPEIPRKYVRILGISEIQYLGDSKGFFL